MLSKITHCAGGVFANTMIAYHILMPSLNSSHTNKSSEWNKGHPG